MGVPKRKTSKSRKRSRQAAKRIKINQAVPCPQCHSPRLPHRICPHCGYYKGKIVTSVQGA